MVPDCVPGADCWPKGFEKFWLENGLEGVEVAKGLVPVGAVKLKLFEDGASVQCAKFGNDAQ